MKAWNKVMKSPGSLEERFRAWVDRAPGISFGNLDYALKDPESIAYDAFQAFKAGWKAAKADKPKHGSHNGPEQR